MDKQPSTYKSDQLAGWLFMAILSLSICTYSGYVANTFSEHRQSTRTEVTVIKSDQAEGADTYDQLQASLFDSNKVSVSNLWVIQLSLHHDRLARIQLEANFGLLLDVEPLFPFSLIKKLPVYTDQRPSPLAIG